MSDLGSVVRRDFRDLSKPLEIRELNRQLDWVWKKILGGLTAKDFSNKGIKDVITVVEKTIAEDIEADEVSANILKVALSEMMVSLIGVAKIDYAQIVDVFANRVFTDVGTAGKFRMDSLEVTQAQIVDLIIGSFRMVSDDGKVYKIYVDADGNLHTEYMAEEDDWLIDGELPDGYCSVASSLTVGDVTAGNLCVSGAADVMKLTAKMLIADQAWINELAAREIFAEGLTANRAFLESLRTAEIVGDKTIEMIAESADEAQQTAEKNAIYDSATPPTPPLEEGKLWLDRSNTPPVLKRWLGGNMQADGSFSHTTSGNPVQTVGKVQRFDSVSGAFGPAQSGEGTPSPTNVRAISPISSLTLTRSGPAGESDTYTVEFSPVYGGRYNFTTGAYSSGMRLVDLADCTLHSVGVASTGAAYARITLPEAATGTEIAACSHYQMVPAGTKYADGMARVLQNIAFLYDARFSSVEAAAAIIAAERPQLAYEAGNATEIQLAPATIGVLAGVNTLRADASCVLTVTYTGTGWEIVNDTDTLRDAQDILIAQQDALRREVNELNSYTKLDGDGLWVGKQGATGQTLLKYDSVNIVVNGKTVATFAGKFVEIGGMRMFTPNAGGLAFAPSGN